METVLIFLLIGLIVLAAIAILVSYHAGKSTERAEWKGRWEEEVGKERESAIAQSRAVLGGKFVEQLAPYLPEFKYDPTEARFIGTPIDLIVFPGLARGEPEQVVFIEVKSGKRNRLTPQEKKIRELIEKGKVSWESIWKQVPE